MKMNLVALQALEAKLNEYSRVNGIIAEHSSNNANYQPCTGCYSQGGCHGTCRGTCVSNCNALHSKY